MISFEIRRKTFKFWRLTSKNEEITFLLSTQFLKKIWFEKKGILRVSVIISIDNFEA